MVIRQEARKLIKTKAPSHYHGTALTLLTNLVDSAYGPEGVREVNVKRETLMRWIHVGSKQLSRILDGFVTDGLLTFTETENRTKITVLMDLSRLEALPVAPTTKEIKADRAAKARAARAAQRELQTAYAEEHF